MSSYHSLRDADLFGKKVIVRAGFDVPLENGVVTDSSRIEAAIPTFKHILTHGGSLIVIAHQDRPKGKVVPEFSQRPIIDILRRLLGVDVGFAESCTGFETKAMVDALTPGQVLLLENLRYDAREEQNDESFARELASYGDMYVNDAFTNCHRTHASMVAIARLLPSYMGLQLEEEVTHLSKVVDGPSKPLTLIVSGAKIETKLPVIEFFLGKGDNILVGGAIANTIIAADGKDVGASLCEKDFYDQARAIVSKSGNGNAMVHVPMDVVVADKPAEDAVTENVSVDEIGARSIFDIGAQTIASYVDCINRSETIVWNGPLGMYEYSPFAEASKRIADAMRAATKRGAVTIIGGGDTIDFHTRYAIPLSDYTFVSTGGGAMLDFVSGKELPALAALKRP